jgi:predicted nucleic acid-binding protein
MRHAVIDTNVVFEGLTVRGGASGLIIEAWFSGLFTACVSNALGYEYVDVLSRKLSTSRWQEIQPVLGTLLSKCEFVTIFYSWRPASPDPGDDHVIDCAMNAGGIVVTHNLADFRHAERSLGLIVLSPVQFVTELAREESI